MTHYIDGYVIPVKKENLDEYQKMAKEAGVVWKDHGALQYVETVGEDMQKHPWCTSFPELVEPKKGETVVFSFIVYKSRKHRDEVNQKAMEDPRLKCEENNAPFDCKRMVFGGFETLVWL